MYQLCLGIACMAHKGQTRWNGEPYITHLVAVANQFEGRFHLRCIAVLHDVIEDTEVTAKYLEEKGIYPQIITQVQRLTKRKDEPYVEYIARVEESFEVSLVKIEDLKHNLSDLKKGQRKDKYELALLILEKSVGDEIRRSLDKTKK